jgi:predicted dinucleotide-binding enzyme
VVVIGKVSDDMKRLDLPQDSTAARQIKSLVNAESLVNAQHTLRRKKLA